MGIESFQHYDTPRESTADNALEILNGIFRITSHSMRVRIPEVSPYLFLNSLLRVLSEQPVRRIAD